MNKNMLPLSLIVSAALTIPSLAMAAPAMDAKADMQAADASADMQAAEAAAMKAEAARANSEPSADQSNPFMINETQRISRASGSSANNGANPQTMPTAIQAQQQRDMQMQVEPQDMQSQEDAMMQEQDAQEAMMQEQDTQEDMMQEDMAE